MERRFTNEKIEKEVEKFLKESNAEDQYVMIRKESFYVDEHTLIGVFTLVQDLEDMAHFFSVIYLFDEKSHKRIYIENYESTRHHGRNYDLCVKSVAQAKIEGNSITMNVFTRSGKEKKIVRRIP